MTALARMLLGRGGGMIAMGAHLGVFVSRPEHMHRCPKAWVFVDVTSATMETLMEAFDVARAGRKAWPRS